MELFFAVLGILLIVVFIEPPGCGARNPALQRREG